MYVISENWAEWITTTFLISGRGESEYVKTSNAKFEQLRGYPQAYAEGIRVYKNKPSAVRINTRMHTDLSHICDKSSERFAPRQTAVCRLNLHVPPRKLKPPQMRRFEFSGRAQILRPVAHTFTKYLTYFFPVLSHYLHQLLQKLRYHKNDLSIS